MDAHGQFVAGLISAAPRAFASGTVLRLQQAAPEVVGQFGDSGFRDLTADTEVRLHYLAEALAMGRPALLMNYVRWLATAWKQRGVSVHTVSAVLEHMRDELAERLPANAREIAARYVDVAIQGLGGMDKPTESPLARRGPLTERAARYAVALLEAERDEALKIVADALADGVALSDVHTDLIGVALAEIGYRWQRGEVTVAEEHLGSRITEFVLAHLDGRVTPAEPNGKRVVVTAVAGNLHDLGARMLAQQLEAAGWKVYLLGANTPTADLIAGLRDFEADLLAVSVHLALQLQATADLIARVSETFADPPLPIIVGGPPFQLVPDLWSVVGADAAANDPAEAVRVATELVGLAGN